jgi:hypothetical protein
MSKENPNNGIPSFLNAAQAMQLVIAETGTHAERGLVLVCGAILDRYLEKLLRMKLADLAPNCTKEEIDFLLTKQPLPPLGSAGVRARMARMMGIVNKDTSKALSVFFNIRNDFAHEEVAPKLELTLIDRVYNALPASEKTRWSSSGEKPLYEDDVPAKRFQIITGMLLHLLSTAELRIVRDRLRTLLPRPTSPLSKEKLQLTEDKLRAIDDLIDKEPPTPTIPEHWQIHL